MRISLALLLLAFVLPATASAQAPPPDERAAAQAFAAAAQRYVAATDRLVREAFPGFCRRGIERLPEPRREDAVAIAFGNGLSRFLVRVREPMSALRTELANVQTLDPALISGRAAWRRIGRAWESVPDGEPACAALKAWRRAGYPRSAVRAAEDVFQRFLVALRPGVFRRLGAAATRMRELGVPAADAERFLGVLGAPEEPARRNRW